MALRHLGSLQTLGLQAGPQASYFVFRVEFM